MDNGEHTITVTSEELQLIIIALQGESESVARWSRSRSLAGERFKLQRAELRDRSRAMQRLASDRMMPALLGKIRTK